jgi:anti-sigma B factor antagonist
MEITKEQNGAVTVVGIVGSLDALTAPQLADFFQQQLAGGNAKLVADLKSLEYTSSAGLRVILNTVKEARQKGGDVRLAGVGPNVSKVFEMSGFHNILKFYPDAAGAVASYGG